MRAKLARDCVVKQFWVSFVEDMFDLDNAIQTRTEFSYATAVMDRIRRSEEEEEGEQEKWMGPRFAANIWIYTKAVVCDGQSHKKNFRIFKLRSILEAVNWVCDGALDDHLWLSEQTTVLQEAKVLEALQYYIEIPCVVQWGMLFSAQTSLNNDLLSDGEILRK